MFIAILHHTPGWVWALLAALVVLGLSQTRDRQASVVRVVAFPLGMVGLSLYGLVGAFGPQPLALAAWVLGAGAALGFARGAVAIRGASWKAATRSVQLPGSWVPLALIVAVFVIKYGVGVNLALQPSLAGDPAFSGGCSLAYGFFSGLFLARALSLRAVLLAPAATPRHA